MEPLRLELPPDARVLFNSLYDTQELRLLDQDILCIQLPNGVQIDTGWYPDHAQDGRYIVRVFKDTATDTIIAERMETKSALEVAEKVARLAEKYSDLKGQQ